MSGKPSQARFGNQSALNDPSPIDRWRRSCRVSSVGRRRARTPVFTDRVRADRVRTDATTNEKRVFTSLKVLVSLDERTNVRAT